MPEDNIIIEEESLDAETIHTEHAEGERAVPNAAPFSVQPEPAKAEIPKAEPISTEPVKAEPVKTEPVKTESVRTEPVKTVQPGSEPPHFTQTPHFEFNRAETPNAEPPEMVIEKAPRRFFRFRREDVEFSRDKWILTHINNDDLLEYLKLEQERAEQLRIAKDVRGKRLMAAFQLAASLAAIVAVVYLLKDVPTILVNILYIVGIIAALWLWKNPRDPGKK